MNIERGITLTDGFFIEIDPLNYTLKRQYKIKDKKTGKEKDYNKTIGYYNGWDQVLMAFVKERQKLRLSDLTINIDEYVRMVDESNKTALSQLKTLLGV